jgi:hypothetical protein
MMTMMMIEKMTKILEKIAYLSGRPLKKSIKNKRQKRSSVVNVFAFFYIMALLTRAVDFRSRRLLSAGRAVSLLVACAPAGSHLSRCSRRSQAPSASINRGKKYKKL